MSNPWVLDDLNTDIPWEDEPIISDGSSSSSVLPPVTGRNDHLADRESRGTCLNLNNFFGNNQDGIPLVDETSTTDSESTDKNVFDVRCLFRNAQEYIEPGRFFRWIVYLFGERKLMVFFLVHLVSTLIIWLHFFLVKFEAQKMSVPEGAPFYWWKRVVPPLEFGSMHAILFQMALIPLTMARFTISQLSGTFLDRFIPLNRTLRMHIYLGYTTVIIVLVATILFFAFFGLLCNNGQDDFCAKFTSEIMATGYGILACLLIVAFTSHFRHKIPYEVFYVIHHLVFVLYAITVAHTFDIEQRRGRANRSQTFKWFSATILYYVCDRVAVHFNQKYRTRLVSSSSISGSNGSKMIILNLKRPALFRFSPGQYAFLKISKIDTHWHPFSIASDPSSDMLEFYAEVFKGTSWTGQLWHILEDQNCDCYKAREIDVEVMGPFGTPLAKTESYSHVLAIGTGTGIVPVLSLFKQQVHQLLRLDPQAHFLALERHRNKIHEVVLAEDSRKGSFAELIGRAQGCNKRRYHELKEYEVDTVRESIRDSIARQSEVISQKEMRRTMSRMKRAAFEASRSIYGTVLLSLLPVIGITLIGLMISWNTIDIQPYNSMVIILIATTIVFQAFFVVVAVFFWDARGMLAYVDLAFCLITPFADWYWFNQCKEHMTLKTGDLVRYCLLTSYMVIRLWSQAAIPKHRSWTTRVEDEGVRTMERFDMVWVAREASLVSEILPDISTTWQNLVNVWGEKDAKAVCRLCICVTDKDKKSQALLENEIRHTSLYKTGSIHFGRPNFENLIQEHTIGLVSSRRYSHSLLAYVGSPQIAKEIHHTKVSNDMVTTITGHTTHDMDFVYESYGGNRETRASSISPVEVNADGPISPIIASTRQDSQVLSIRKMTSYEEKERNDETDEGNSFSESSLFTSNGREGHSSA